MEDEYNEKMFEEMELLVKKENIIADIIVKHKDMTDWENNVKGT